MGLRGFIHRLLDPGRLEQMAAMPLDTLVDAPRVSATRLGAAPTITPWSAGRLMSIFQEFERSPSFGSLMEARLARQCLSQFWLTAPVDQLDLLYRSVIGECYRVLLAGPLSQEALTQEESAWRSVLSERLTTSFQRPETTNILLAVMPYFPPGKMRVSDPMSQVPEWLQEDYGRLFDQELFQRVWKPAGLLSPSGSAYGQAPDLGIQFGVPSTQSSGSQADARFNQPEIPLRLAREGGAAALAMVQNADYVGRMNGLINLHVIDPNDLQVREQLVALRRQLGQIWLDAKPEQVQSLYRNSLFGRLYRDLMASGFPRRELSADDKLLRNQLARKVADMSKPGSINALMAALPFYPPGKIAFSGGERHMPDWLVQEISTIYGEPPPPISG